MNVSEVTAIPASTLMIVIQPTMPLSDEAFQRMQISVESIRGLLPPHVPVVLLENCSLQLIDANEELRKRIEALEKRLRSSENQKPKPENFLL